MVSSIHCLYFLRSSLHVILLRYANWNLYEYMDGYWWTKVWKRLLNRSKLPPILKGAEQRGLNLLESMKRMIYTVSQKTSHAHLIRADPRDHQSVDPWPAWPMTQSQTMAWVDQDYLRIMMSSRLLPSILCNLEFWIWLMQYIYSNSSSLHGMLSGPHNCNKTKIKQVGRSGLC